MRAIIQQTLWQERNFLEFSVISRFIFFACNLHNCESYRVICSKLLTLSTHGTIHVITRITSSKSPNIIAISREVNCKQLQYLYNLYQTSFIESNKFQKCLHSCFKFSANFCMFFHLRYPILFLLDKKSKKSFKNFNLIIVKCLCVLILNHCFYFSNVCIIF